MGRKISWSLIWDRCLLVKEILWSPLELLWCIYPELDLNRYVPVENVTNCFFCFTKDVYAKKKQKRDKNLQPMKFD